MEKIKKDDSYAHILKYTGVFVGVQGLNILVEMNQKMHSYKKK